MNNLLRQQNTAEIFNLPIGPGCDQETALRLIDKVMSQIERLLQDMEDRRSRLSESSIAFQKFMEALVPSLIDAGLGTRIRVKYNASWIKIESMVNGHKIYVSKGKLAVGRVECTLPPELVRGARQPGRHNGKIASWLPTDTESVGKAIILLGDVTTKTLK